MTEIFISICLQVKIYVPVKLAAAPSTTEIF